MPEEVIEELAEANNQTSNGKLNPFKMRIGETLPSNVERNFSGFLIQKEAITFKVDTQKLNARIALLKDQLLIAKFIGTKPQIQDINAWLQTLNLALRGNTLTICQNVGKGFFFLSSDNSDALHNALMLSPFKSKWGTCIFQSWIPRFNLENLSNLAFLTWVVLRRLPFEQYDQAIAIVGTLGEVIGMDTANDTAKDPRFCINLKVKEGWITSIALDSEDGSAPIPKVLVYYDKLPIKGRACQSWKHMVRDCKEQHRIPSKGDRKQPYSFRANQQQDKGKQKIVDEDGFQQLQNRKGTRRNIFEKENEKMTHANNQEGASPAEANPARGIHNAEGGINILMGQHNLGEGQMSTGKAGLTVTTLPKYHTTEAKEQAAGKTTTKHLHLWCRRLGRQQLARNGILTEKETQTLPIKQKREPS